ncbi:MAG: nuclease-related domain-containing protein [Gammaproteobacteria bacterium]|nr:nuclease-related domain-containing protein [Gammaproteobacteria bacterium]
MDKSKLRKKSPLKKRPRRNAGDSTHNMILEATDQLLPYWIMTIMLVLYASLEFQDIPRLPLLWLAIATLFFILTTWKTLKAWPRIKAMKQGRDGERRIGQYLDNEFRDDLTGTPIRIFHDVPGENFNLDHVIICEKGIYVLETKTLSVPIKGLEKLFYKGGDHLYYKNNGARVPGNPIGQVKAGVKWLRELLHRQYELEEKQFPKLPIRGVLVPADRFVHNDNIGEYDIWVLNQKAFAKFINNEKDRLSPETVRSCGDLIAGYTRRKLDEESKKLI